MNDPAQISFREWTRYDTLILYHLLSWRSNTDIPKKLDVPILPPRIEKSNPLAELYWKSINAKINLWITKSSLESRCRNRIKYLCLSQCLSCICVWVYNINNAYIKLKSIYLFEADHHWLFQHNFECIRRILKKRRKWKWFLALPLYISII